MTTLSLCNDLPDRPTMLSRIAGCIATMAACFAGSCILLGFLLLLVVVSIFRKLTGRSLPYAIEEDL